MRCEEAQELITALVDNELSGEESYSIKAHFKDCRRCRFTYEQELALKREIRLAGVSVRAPADLRESILSDRRIFPERANLAKEWKRLFRPLTALRPAFIAALLLLIIIPLLYLMWPPKQSIAQAALETHEKIVGGAIVFTRLGDQQKVEEFLLRSVEGKFSPMGYDLSTIGLQAIGGLVQEFAGRKILVAIYEGKGPTLGCYTFLGTEKDTPTDATLFFDQEKGINFYTFSQGRINAVTQRVGEKICILVSEMPMQDLLTLARSLAQPTLPS